MRCSSISLRSILAIAACISMSVASARAEVTAKSLKNDLKKGFNVAAALEKKDNILIKEAQKIVKQRAGILVLRGDFNEDGVIDDLDKEILAGCLGANEMTISCVAADLSGDGVVNLADISVFARLLFASQDAMAKADGRIRGDINRDGFVNKLDEAGFRACYADRELAAPELDCEMADINIDGALNLADVSLFAGLILK